MERPTTIDIQRTQKNRAETETERMRERENMGPFVQKTEGNKREKPQFGV